MLRCLTSCVIRSQSISCENVSRLIGNCETAVNTVPFDLEDVSEAQRRLKKGVAGLVAFLPGPFCDALSVGEQRLWTRCNAASITNEATDVPERTL